MNTHPRFCSPVGTRAASLRNDLTVFSKFEMAMALAPNARWVSPSPSSRFVSSSCRCCAECHVAKSLYLSKRSKNNLMTQMVSRSL